MMQDALLARGGAKSVKLNWKGFSKQMEHRTFTTPGTQNASPVTGPVGPKKTSRALRKSITESRELQENLRGSNPRDPLAIRLAAFHVELNRLRTGEKIRFDILIRSLSGIQSLVPVREQSRTKIYEVAAR